MHPQRGQLGKTCWKRSSKETYHVSPDDEQSEKQRTSVPGYGRSKFEGPETEQFHRITVTGKRPVILPDDPGEGVDGIRRKEGECYFIRDLEASVFKECTNNISE